MRQLLRFTGGLGLWLLCGVANAGPSLADKQLDYAKEEYGKGVAAMGDKEYAKATRHFEEAYRYAPDKHAFNFNIGEAALAAGDCTKARSSYQAFLQYVPEHEEADTATRRLEKTVECRSAVDNERPEFGPSEDLGPDLAALYAAVSATRHARDLFGQVQRHHADAKIFSKAQRKHARQIEKLVKVILKRGAQVPKEEWKVDEMAVGGTLKEVCGQALEEERAMREAYKAATEKVQDRKELKVLRKSDKVAEKYEPQFKFCARK